MICSRPHGEAVNDYVGDQEKQLFQSVDDAAKLVTKGCYMAKGRSQISIQISTYKCAQSKCVRYFIDNKLPFGPSQTFPGS